MKAHRMPGRGVAVALALIVLLVVAACAGQPAPATQPTAAPAAKTTAAPAAAPTVAPVPTAAATTVAAAAPTAVAPGQFKGTIKIGLMSDYSGPAASSAGVMSEAQLDYFRYLNEQKGGVAGYKIEGVNVDTKLDATLARSGYKRLQETLQGPGSAQLALAPVAPVFAFLKDAADSDQFVLFMTSCGPKEAFVAKADVAAGKNSFWYCGAPTAVEKILLETQWAVQDWKSKGKPGKPKIGIFMLDGDYFGVSTNTAKIAAKQYGAEFTVATSAAGNVTDAVSQVTLLKQAGADYVLSSASTDAIDLVFARDSARLDYHPQYLGHGSIASAATSAKEKGLVGAMFYLFSAPWAETSVPEIQLMHQINAQYHPDKPNRNDLYPNAWMNAMVAAEGLRIAIDRFGADKLAGDNIRRAFDSISNFSTNGLSGPWTFTPRDHRGTASLKFYRVTDQFTTVPVTDWLQTPPFTDEQLDPNYWYQ